MAKTNIIENLFSYFPYIALGSAFLPVFLFFVHWEKCKDSRALWAIILYDILVDFLIAYGTGVTHHKVKITLYAAFTFFEYLAFAYFIFLQIRKAAFKKFMGFASFVFLIFIIVYYVTVKFSNIDSIPIGFEIILVLIFSFYYLYEQMTQSSNLFIYSTSTFWVVLGIVLYMAGNFFIYIFAGSFLTRAQLNDYWYITNIFSIVKNIFFCIAILIHTKPSKDKFNYNIDLSRLN